MVYEASDVIIYIKKNKKEEESRIIFPHFDTPHYILYIISNDIHL